MTFLLVHQFLSYERLNLLHTNIRASVGSRFFKSFQFHWKKKIKKWFWISFGVVYYVFRDQVIALWLNKVKLSINYKSNPIKGQAKKCAFGQCWVRRFVWYIQSIHHTTLISFSYKCFYKLHLLQNFPYFHLLYSHLVVNIGAIN